MPLAWHERNVSIADRVELDLGYRLLIATYRRADGCLRPWRDA
ncbi:MAG TPA: hypothetical protein VFG31_03110 [Conexibacter sp.]|nr:hypothetical protein [Conexibacter sp.]